MTGRLSSAEVYDQAAYWVAKRDAGPLTPEEQAALEAWLALDPRHHGAFVQAVALLAPSSGPVSDHPSIEPGALSGGGRRSID
jgi:transmembrane sensor